MLKKMISFAAVAGLVLALAGTARAALINVDFNNATANGGSPTPTYSGAAAVGSAGDYWNGLNLTDGWGADNVTFTFSTIKDSSGSTLTGVSVVVSGRQCVNPWGWSSDSNPYTDLLRDYDAYNPTVTVSGLTEGMYDIYLYAGAVRPTYVVNGVTATQLTDTGNTTGLVLNGNYTVLQNVVVGSDGKLTISSAPHDPNSWDYAISGFQIVPEPATMVLLGLGGLGVLLKRRRRYS